MNEIEDDIKECARQVKIAEYVLIRITKEMLGNLYTEEIMSDILSLSNSNSTLNPKEILIKVLKKHNKLEEYNK